MSTAKTLAAVALVIIVLASSAVAIYSYTRKVTGISMTPTLENGDLVVIQPVPITQITVGDIIVYTPPCSSGGEAVIHRTVGVSGDGFITKGDGNPATDQAVGIATQPVTQNCIEGKVVFVIPYLEKLSELPYGLNYVIAAAIVAFVLLGELRALKGGDESNPDAAAEDAKSRDSQAHPVAIEWRIRARTQIVVTTQAVRAPGRSSVRLLAWPPLTS